MQNCRTTYDGRLNIYKRGSMQGDSMEANVRTDIEHQIKSNISIDQPRYLIILFIIGCHSNPNAGSLALDPTKCSAFHQVGPV
jgi:hypothetical protein